MAPTVARCRVGAGSTCTDLSRALTIVHRGKVLPAQRGRKPARGHEATRGGTFALIEALEKRLELLLIEDGTFRVSLPQGHPRLLQPGNLGRPAVSDQPGKGPARGHRPPAEWTPRGRIITLWSPLWYLVLGIGAVLTDVLPPILTKLSQQPIVQTGNQGSEKGPTCPRPSHTRMAELGAEPLPLGPWVTVH